jgi:hypothetical protein
MNDIATARQKARVHIGLEAQRRRVNPKDYPMNTWGVEMPWHDSKVVTFHLTSRLAAHFMADAIIRLLGVHLGWRRSWFDPLLGLDLLRRDEGLVLQDITDLCGRFALTKLLRYYYPALHASCRRVMGLPEDGPVDTESYACFQGDILPRRLHELYLIDWVRHTVERGDHDNQLNFLMGHPLHLPDGFIWRMRDLTNGEDVL